MKAGVRQAEREGPIELRKPHEMVVMVTKTGRMTVTGRKVYTVMLAISQRRLESMDSMPAADYMFEAPLNAMLRSSGSSTNDRSDAKRYLREMRDFAVDWESTAPGDGIKWQGFSMLSEVIIELKNGENWVKWSFPPTIMSALRDPTRWARIELDMIAKLGSYAAIAIYEVCARYRDNPSGLTSRKSTAWWSDATSQTPGATERREWRKIKNERVKPAIEEINEQTDLEIELIEHKQGRAVVEVQFAIRKKKVVPVERRVDEPVDAHLIVRCESLGIRAYKTEALIKEFGEDLVREKVEVLESRIGNSTLRMVENVFSYLRSLLRNHQQGDLTQSESVDSAPPAENTEAGKATNNQEHEPVVSPEEKWVEARREEIRQRIEAMSPTVKKALLDEALADLQSRGVLTAVVSRRAAQGDITHGILGVTVVRIFALREYGEGWNKMPQGTTTSNS
jgi:hypothetical protein